MPVLGGRSVSRQSEPHIDSDPKHGAIGGRAEISLDFQFEYRIPSSITSSAQLLDAVAKEERADRHRIDSWSRHAEDLGVTEKLVDWLKLVHSEFHTNAFYHGLLGLSSLDLLAFQDLEDSTGKVLREHFDERLKNKEDPIHDSWIRFQVRVTPGELKVYMSDSGPGPSPTEEGFAKMWQAGLRHLQSDHALSGETSGRGLAFVASIGDSFADLNLVSSNQDKDGGAGVAVTGPSIEFSPRDQFPDGANIPYWICLRVPLDRAAEG